jgi:hypothetical protein
MGFEAFAQDTIKIHIEAQIVTGKPGTYAPFGVEFREKEAGPYQVVFGEQYGRIRLPRLFPRQVHRHDQKARSHEPGDKPRLEIQGYTEVFVVTHPGQEFRQNFAVVFGEYKNMPRLGIADIMLCF